MSDNLIPVTKVPQMQPFTVKMPMADFAAKFLSAFDIPAEFQNWPLQKFLGTPDDGGESISMTLEVIPPSIVNDTE